MKGSGRESVEEVRHGPYRYEDESPLIGLKPPKRILAAGRSRNGHHSGEEVDTRDGIWYVSRYYIHIFFILMKDVPKE